MHYEDYVKRFKKKVVRVVSEIYIKALKVQILNEVALRQLDRWLEHELVFKGLL